MATEGWLLVLAGWFLSFTAGRIYGRFGSNALLRRMLIELWNCDIRRSHVWAYYRDSSYPSRGTMSKRCCDRCGTWDKKSYDTAALETHGIVPL